MRGMLLFKNYISSLFEKYSLQSLRIWVERAFPVLVVSDLVFQKISFGQFNLVGPFKIRQNKNS